MIRIENIRDMHEMRAARRFLIDREWPKGVVRAIPHNEESGQSRGGLGQIRWSPELAPSPALWKWFHHDPEKIRQFRDRYFRELDRKKKSWISIARASEEGSVTLLYHGKRARLPR